ncbi:phage baseplate assembly protein V [Chitinophaga sp. Cy-1792]|uniref:phage baseplate assembly protein V n=1 Tax=Chitinophaga sp. Cy-1792 TaxID=2608339 RepID=UPI001420EDD4|nr:phage baseplate assembly protein V [Chitinophaga sp. Cy-1792]
MTAIATISVILDGEQYTNVLSLQLEQYLHMPHGFELMVPGNWLQQQHTPEQLVQRLLGKQLEINLQTGSRQKNTFRGLVTSVHINATAAGHGSCIVKGSSPDITLHRTAAMQVFENKSAATLAKDFTTSLRQTNISPKAHEPIPYLLQCQETNLLLLQRIAVLYKEWCFYDGTTFHFGNYQPAYISLQTGIQLLDFEISVAMPAPAAQVHCFDYMLSSQQYATVKDLPKDNYLHHLFDEVTVLNNASTLISAGASAESEAIMQQAVDKQTRTLFTQGLQLRGRSIHAGIRPGDIIRVEPADKSKSYGDFRVMAVRHFMTGDHSYYNTFQAISTAVEAPGYNVETPRCHGQSAVVTDNEDPENLGRVKVRYQWQTTGSSPWMRIMQPVAGNGKGWYFLPEINEEVWIGYEQQHSDKPFVAGSFYNNSQRPAPAAVQNNLKVIRSRSGHTITLDDTPGAEQVHIADKGGNQLLLDTSSGTMQLQAPELITLHSKNILLKADAAVTLAAAGDVSISAASNLYQYATATAVLSAGELSLITDKQLSLFAAELKAVSENAALHSTKGDFLIKSAKALHIQGEEKINMH